MNSYKYTGKKEFDFYEYQKPEKFDIQSIKDETKKYKKNIKKILNNYEAKKSSKTIILIDSFFDTGISEIEKALSVFNILNTKFYNFSIYKDDNSFTSKLDFINNLPCKINIINNSYYSTAMHDILDNADTQYIYKEIKNLENNLDAKIIKIFLTTSKESEQKLLKSFLDDKEKKYLFSIQRITDINLLPDMRSIYANIFKNTADDENPHFIIPLHSKEYANYLFLKIVNDILSTMNLENKELSTKEKIKHAIYSEILERDINKK